MITRKEQMEIQQVENAANGEGWIEKMHILKPEETLDKSKLFARITLPPSSRIGEHSHFPEAEVYYILKGEATVTDDDKTEILSAGDVLFTGDHHRHSIQNNTDEVVEFLAVILA